MAVKTNTAAMCRRMLMVSVSRCDADGKGFAAQLAETEVGAPTKKSGPITGATVQKRQRVGNVRKGDAKDRSASRIG